MHTDTLNQLSKSIEKCRVCRDRPHHLPRLPHEPRPVVYLSSTARIAIAGQAPGNIVNKTGIPFNDPSGERLRTWLSVSREQFYDRNLFSIIPMAFCFPGYDDKGADLLPRRECREAWHEKIFAQHNQFELVLAIGACAQRFHLQTGLKPTLTETVANWRTISTIRQERGYFVIPLPHPSWRNTAWIKKNPWFTKDLLPFLKSQVKVYIEREQSK